MVQSELDFSNTRIAFAARSDDDLKRSHLMFRLMGISPLVRIGPKFVTASLRMGLPVSGLLRATIFRQFCGGETLDDCLTTANSLAKTNVRTILDYSVEGGSTAEAKDAAVEEVLRTISFATKNPTISFSVFKPSGLTRLEPLEKRDRGTVLSASEAAEYEAFRARVLKICQASAAAGVRVFIDAEESWIQDSIDAIALEMMQRFNKQRVIVYTTLQLYRHDRLAFLSSLAKRAADEKFHVGVKLVRGAYMDKENDRAAALGYTSPIHADKAGTDMDYDEAIRLALNHIDRVAFCVGTHNESSCKLATELMRKAGIKNDDPRVEFAQLLGMGDHLSYNLASAGYRVSKYVPYGPIREVLPYLFRRAEENLSIRGQTGRELGLIIQELKRRGLKN